MKRNEKRPRRTWVASLFGAALITTGFSPAPTEAGLGENPASLMAPPRKGNWAAYASPPNTFGMERHARYVDEGRRRAGEIRVLFVGDSITQLWESSGRDVWAKRIAPLGAAQFGIGGESTMHLLWHIQNGELDTVRPKVLVLLIGTNNLSMNTPEETADAVRVIVGSVRRKLPASKILLLGLLPKVVPGAHPNDPPIDRRPKVHTVNALLAKFDTPRAGIHYLDIGLRFETAGGDIDRVLLPDGIHPSAKGYAVWAEAISPTLRSMLKNKQAAGRAVAAAEENDGFTGRVP